MKSVPDVMAFRTTTGELAYFNAPMDVLGCLASALVASGIGVYSNSEHVWKIDVQKAKELGRSLDLAKAAVP